MFQEPSLALILSGLLHGKGGSPFMLGPVHFPGKDELADEDLPNLFLA
jgi:hypothetical protein